MGGIYFGGGFFGLYSGVSSEPCSIDMSAEYLTAIDLIGEYMTAIDLAGSYEPTIDMQGVHCPTE